MLLSFLNKLTTCGQVFGVPHSSCYEVMDLVCGCTTNTQTYLYNNFWSLSEGQPASHGSLPVW